MSSPAVNLTELERLLAECNRERERADRGVCGDFGEIEAWDNLVGACVHALPFLLAEARKAETLRRDIALAEQELHGFAVRFDEAHTRAITAEAQVETLREALRRIAEFGEERSFSIPADQMACLARTALEGTSE